MTTYEGTSCIINYNSDMSGDIIIKSKTPDEKGNYPEVSVLGKDILKFVAEYVRDQKIAKAENASWKKLLGL